MRRILFTASLLTALLATACDKPAPPPVTSGNSQSGASAPPKLTGVGLPAGLMTTGTVADATPVGKAKATAKQGDTVTVVGRIGGSRVPFNAGRAVFTIVDPSLKACSDISGDECKTPWDYCCEPSESLKANTATVEVVGADGRPLQFSVKGASGLQPLATVAVTGKVIEKNDQGVFLVRAEKISVKQ